MSSNDSVFSPIDPPISAVAVTTSKTDPLDNADDNANEVTETKHNNKSEPDTTPKKQAVVCHADTDRKKNGTIAEARENYKFDVSKTLNFKTIYVILYFHTVFENH